jgi:3(or 17)beta-hydroxysteroid dehydrogenase
MAASFIAEGARVVLADRDRPGGERAASDLGPQACFVPLDVTDEAQWIAALDSAVALLGRLDGLVNNAGIAVMGDAERTSLADWRRVNAVNVEGTFLGCKHGIPHLRASGGGSIVNISSVAGLVAAPNMAAYAASKGAVRALTKSVAVALARKRDAIRCNSIHPVFIQTAMVDEMVAGSRNPDRMAEGLAASIPLGRIGEPQDVAAIAVYLVSDESRFVTGAEFVIDGGFCAA